MSQQRFVSLLRGINVSGQKQIKMVALKQMFERLNFENVVTYIQSGNILFSSFENDLVVIKGQLESGILNEFGFEVDVFVFHAKDWGNVILQDPFSSLELEARYVTFLSTPADVSLLSGVESIKLPEERIVLKDSVLYLYCPKGYGKTKLSNTFFEKRLKQSCTTRNWKTVVAFSALLS